MARRLDALRSYWGGRGTVDRTSIHPLPSPGRNRVRNVRPYRYLPMGETAAVVARGLFPDCGGWTAVLEIVGRWAGSCRLRHGMRHSGIASVRPPCAAGAGCSSSSVRDDVSHHGLPLVGRDGHVADDAMVSFLPIVFWQTRAAHTRISGSVEETITGNDGSATKQIARVFNDAGLG